MSEIEIAGRKIGYGHKPWVVAEVGINHDGSVERALQMVGVAAKAGVDAVKFGAFKAAGFCSKNDPLYETFRRCELPDDAWYEIKARCVANNVTFFATPQNESDLEILLKVGVPCVKVGSDDLSNSALISAYAAHGLPLILSIGMADMRDVNAAWEAAKSVPLIICCCTSEYPCPPESANLARLTQLALIYDEVTGFSDHTIGPQAATVAVGLGASYYEKHFTLDNKLSGPDHAFSANPWQLGEWVAAIHDSYAMLGSGRIEPTDTERQNRTKWRRISGQTIRGIVADNRDSLGDLTGASVFRQ